MAMSVVSSALGLLAMMHPVDAYTCPSGYADKDGTPKCAGVVASSCTTSTCCKEQETCSDFSVAWALSQLAGGGCAEDTKFFDTKKNADTVAAPAGVPEVKAACCTDFADAKCSDWAAVLGSCNSGQNFVGTNSAPPDNADGKTLSSAKYKEMCCVTPPDTCSDFSVAWALSQLAGGGCAEDTKFFDTKKDAATVAAPAGVPQVKAACCTDFADAKCSDWVAVLGSSCNSGHVFVGTNSAPPDNADGDTVSSAKYKEMCCMEPVTCASMDNEVDSAFQPAVSMVAILGLVVALIVG